MSFNPYTWDSTKERVDSEVLFLDLKDNKSELLEVSSLPEDIVIVIPSKPRTMPKELWYFTTDDDLRFHEITVKYENTLIQVEVKPQEPTVHLFVANHSKLRSQCHNLSKWTVRLDCKCA